MRNSNYTSMSFTVNDDLISQSSLGNTRMTAFHGLKPFSKEINKHNWQDIPVPNQKNKQIMEKAQRDAFRQMNQQMYNPFAHKLNGGFVPSEMDLYNKQKQRQLEMIKKQQESMMNNSRNYKIVFSNPQNDGAKVFKMAANNVLTQDNNIQDYYNKKFAKKKEMDLINQEHEQQDQDLNNIKRNNFVKSVKANKKTDNRKISSEGNIQGNNKNEKKPVSIPNNNKKPEPKGKLQQQQKISLNEEIKKPIANIQKPKIVEKKEIKQIKPKTNQVEKPTIKNPIPRLPPKNSKPNKAQQKTKKKYLDVYQGPDRNLVEQLENQLSQCPNITFDQIAELDTAKSLLQEAVLLPRLMPQFFKGIRRATKGILLFGPPGTGKTLLAKAIANKNMFFNVSASSLASKWKGQSEKMVRLLFQIAKYYSPSVIFFDEIDSIASKRSENEHQSARKVKTQLLVQMDGVGSSDNEVFVLAATNRPWDLDQALRRRLQKRIYIPLPGKEGRKKMFEINLKDVKVDANVNWNKLVQLTKGCSGADICNICRDAALMPMRRRLKQIGGVAKLAQLKQEQLIEISLSQKDIEQAANKIKPSVGNQDLKRYAQWMKQFGSS